MRTSLNSLFASCIFLIPGSTLAQSSSVKGESGGVALEVFFQPSYPKSSEVTVSHTITNVSGGQIKTIRATDTYDLKIHLFDPGGNLIQPFPRSAPQFKRFMTTFLLPDKPQSDSLNLSVYYPISEAGEYLCSVTRQVYDAAALVASEITRTRPGTPMQIAAPEFRFSVASIDPTYKSPLADAVPRPIDAKTSPSSGLSHAQELSSAVPSTLISVPDKKPLSTQREKPTSSTPWLVWAAVIAMAIGLLWLALKNNK